MIHLSTIMRRFLAGLTILSVTFTQAVPARALRPGQEAQTRATGLEEALQVATGEGEAVDLAALDTADEVIRILRGFLPLRFPQQVGERIAALKNAYGPFDSSRGRRGLPAAATDLMRRLALAVSDGVLSLDEAKDPMLALALMAPGNRSLQDKAERTVQAWERLCPNCAEHALHEMVSAEELTVVEHGALDLLSGVATALDLILLNGDLLEVDGVAGVDHGKEIARTAQTVAWLHEVVGGSSATPGRVDLTQENLARLAGLDAPVVALVSHSRTPGWNADHYVSILHVDLVADGVVYLDNGEKKTVSLNDFIHLHRPHDGRALLFLDAARAQRLQAAGLSWTPLSQKDSAKWAGACGIILHVGRYSQEGGLASAFDAAYRGKDNTGEIVIEPTTGLRRVTVQGSPSALVKSFQLLGQGYPEEAMAWYLEANPDSNIPVDLKEALEMLRAGGILTDRQRYLIHRKWRTLTQRETTLIQDLVSKKSEQILREQGLGWVRTERLDVVDPETHQRRPAVKDDLYRLSFYSNGDEAVDRGQKKPGDVRMDNAVGRGKRGAVWSGRGITLKKVSPAADWQSWQQALLDAVDQVRRLYRYDLTAIREILRYELSDILERRVKAGQVDLADAARMESIFIRHFDQVWAGQDLKPEEQSTWKAAWTALVSEPTRIAGHVSPDPVRHSFRIQGSLAASLLKNPAWEARVQEIFEREMPASRKSRSWYDDWRVESNTCTPGLAFAAVTEWFQERFMNPEQRAKVETGQMDALTLSYMHIVDRKLRHDRWATTGSRIPKDAQPVTDTGLLSNIDSTALLEIMAVVKRRYNREIAREESETGQPCTIEKRTNTLRNQFLLVLRNYLDRHPKMRGAPARGFAHNGDLSPVVQNGILPLLRANGYLNRQTRVDAETGETKREMILTDTWKLGALVEFIYDAWRKDRALGGVLDDAEGMQYVRDPSACFMPLEYRALWNSIQTTLHSQQMAFSPEELAHRVALMEFGRGVRVTPGKASSEIALGWISLYDPALDGVVSHRRAVELVVVRDTDGNLQVQYTSDALTALRMFDPKQVETAIQNDTRISAEFRDGIYDLVRRRKLAQAQPEDPQGLDAQQFEQEMRLLVARARDAEKKANAFKAELSLTLKGEQKYVKVRKVWNPSTNRFEVEIDITNFEGERLATIRPGQPDDIIEAEKDNIKVHRNRNITIAAASKGGFPTFGLKEIDSELSALALMRVHAGIRVGDAASLDITQEGLQKTAGELTALLAPPAPVQQAGLEEAEGGLNQEAIGRFLANAIKTGKGTNVLTGVGSSENDSSAARTIFRYLLPGVGYDNITPARLISTAAHYDPDSTLAGGISWSGTTALTLLALQWLQSQGIAVSGLTGNPTVKDLADIVEGSAGTVHARTKKEVAIYTTVGFLMLLEGLFEEAIQQNLIAEQVAADQAVKDDLRRRREEIWDDYASMVENLAGVLGDPERDYFREGSRMSRASRHFSKFLGMRFIGDYYNNPIVEEIGIKVGETRNINFTCYDYRSYGYRADAAKGGNTGWFLNATSLNRIREATQVLKEAQKNGMSVIVQTFGAGEMEFTDADLEQGYDKDWEEFQRELGELERDFNGEGENPLAVRFEVPRLHFTLQPMLDVIAGQLFGVGLALAAGYSNEATDGPRNLAKSVTVLGVQLAFGALITLDKFFYMEAQEPGRRAEEMASYRTALAARWAALSSVWEMGLHRLPLRSAELLQRLRVEGDFQIDEAEMRASFGPTLGDLRRIVILYDTDEAAEVAGRMAGIPLANSEMVLSDSQDDKLFARVKDKRGKYLPREIRRAINGREAKIRFVRSQTDSQAENRISIQFDGEAAPAIEFSGDEKGILKAVQAQVDVDYNPVTRILTLAERQYELKVLGQRGISLAATQPDLLGIPVEIHRPTDFTLGQDTDKGTLVVAISRSNHKGSADNEVAGIASAEAGRNAAEKTQTAAKGISEGDIGRTLQTLRDKEVAIFTVGDKESVIHSSATHGSAVLEGSDLDSMSAVTQYYTALLLLGSRMGAMRGVPDAPAYERALDMVPNIEARTLASLYTEEAETGTRLFWPDVAGVTVNIGHAPVTCAYAADAPTPGQGVKSGTVRLTRGSAAAAQTVLELKVEVSNDEITGIRDPQPQYLIGGRAFRVTFAKARGLVFRGVEPDYAGGGNLRDALISLRQNHFPGRDGKPGKQYRSWGVIGGVQDRAGAAAIAMALERAGYQARHLEVDESVHGWYALINDAVEKYPDLFFREGVSPDFDPDNMEDGQQEGKDVGIVILATDTRTFGASIIDAQRARTRNARFILVVKESDRDNEEVVNAGAYAVITVPDAFNEMSSFSHDLIGQALARELAHSEEPAYAYEPGSERAALALLPATEMRDVTAQASRSGLSPIDQDRIETELEGRNRPPEQVDQFVRLFFARRVGNQPIVTQRAREGSYHCVYAAFPYRESAGSNPVTGIPSSLGVPVHGAFVTTVSEADGTQPIAMVRLEIDRAEDAEIAMRQMERAVAPYNAAAGQYSVPLSAVSPAVLPAHPVSAEAATPRSRDEIALRLAERFVAEPGVYLDFEYDPGADTTTFVIIGESNQPGLLNAIAAPLADAGMNILDHGSLRDHGDASYVTAKGRVPEAALAAIADKANSIVPLHFSGRIREENPLLTPEQVETLYDDFRSARREHKPSVSVSASPYPVSAAAQAVVTSALPDFPESDLHRGQVMDSIRSSVEQAGRQIVGQVTDVSYRGIRLIVLNLDNLESSTSVRSAVENIREALDSLTGPAPPQAPLTTAGLEEAAVSESPLDLPLPDRWPTYQQVIERLRQAGDSSGFLRVVRDQLQIQTEGIPLGYRPLSSAEIRALEENRVTAVNGWSRIFVPETFGPDDIARMSDVRLGGTVVLGHLLGNTALGPQGIPLESRIKNTDLYNVVVGHNVLIRDNVLIQRYVIGTHAVITHNQELTAERGTSFGLGVSIPVGPETGGRAFKAYPEILFEDVIRLVSSPRDPEREAYDREHAQYVKAARADYGYIGMGALVSGNGTAKNLFIADGGVFVDTPKAENVILAGQGTGSEQSRVEGAGAVLNVIAQQGVRIGPQAVVIGTSAKETGVLLLEHSHVEGALVQDSVIAPNSGAGRGAGEVTSAVMGPFTGMHHGSLLIAAILPGMGNIGAEAAIHSNHTSRQPSEEFWSGEGDFYGLNTSYSGTTNLQDAPYSIWAKVDALAQVMSMPFSLVQEPTITIPGASPGLMQITPGWVWSDNAYAILRNEGKYAKRDRAKNHNLGMGDLQRRPYEVLRPSIVNKMIRARDALRSVDTFRPRKGVIPTANPQRPKIILYYTDSEIPGLGKNFMLEDARAKAIETYNFMIEYYALRGLYEEVKKLETAGRLSQAAALMSAPSRDLRWEHERRTLLTELPGWTVTSALQQFTARQATLRDRVYEARDKDNQRGEKYLPGYNEAHDSVVDDTFVQQVIRDTQAIQQDVERLIAALPQAGLEEVDPAALRAERLPQDSASVAKGIGIIAGPHVSGLAIGAALSKVRTNDGTPAAQVVFVVENEAEAELVNQLAVPLMVFSASDPRYGSVEAALLAARDLMRGAQELGTDNQPVSQTIQQLLRNLFGIEINLGAELMAWNNFIGKATLAIQA